MKKITMFFMSLISFSAFAQLDLEDFEGNGNTLPTDWLQVNVAGPAQQWIIASHNAAIPSFEGVAGTHAAYINRETVAPGNTAEDWLITPVFTVPNAPQLRFFSRLTQGGDQFSTYRVMINTAGTTDPDDFVELQNWTELTINPTQETYTEKIVDLPAAEVGNPVRLAFVMNNNNGDRWLVDMVQVVEECLPPTNLGANSFGLETATLTWDNPVGATEFEVEVVGALGVPTGNGESYTDEGDPYEADGLTEDTDYKFYVRTICADGNESEWAGPFYFSTVALGSTCGAPIEIEALSYTDTNNTAGYGNDYSGSPGSSGCGTTNAYLNGDDVVYAYEATEDGVISVDLTNNGAYSGVFVYDDCADIGVSCIGGGTTGFAPAPISYDVSVTEGVTYYFVISTWAAPQTTPYTLTIQVVNCPPPSGLGVANVDEDSADLNWVANGSTSWEVVVQNSGSGIPAGAGTTTTDNTDYNVTATSAGVDFTEATSYEFYVRADCGDGTFSEWTGPFVFTTTQVPATMDYSQNFDGGASGFTLGNGTQTNKWAIGTATSNSPTTSLYISNDNGTSNTFNLNATSVVHAYRDIQMPAAVDQVSVSFDWKNQGESCCDYLRVWLVPAATYTPTPGTLITAAASGGTQIGGNYNVNGNWTTVNAVVNAAAYSGQVMRIIFEWRNDGSIGTQPPAAVDNINVAVITCPSPTNLAVAAFDENEATFTWTAPTSVTPTYDYYLSTTNTAPTAGTTPTDNVSATTVTEDGLTPSTTYYFWVRSNCGPGDTSFWVGPVSFITPQIPASLDYTENFDGGLTGWTLSNGTQTNKWVIGTATSNSPDSSLYISNDNGVSNAFSVTATSVVHAYRDIEIPAGTSEIDFSYDWKNVGESCCDYLRVWVVPVTYTPNPGTLITAGASGGVQYGGNQNVNANWATQNFIINASGYAGTVRRFIFEWRNDGSIGTQPPAAVDNINISIVTCPKPTALTASGITDTGATLGWTEAGTADEWEVYVVTAGSAAPTAATDGEIASEDTFDTDILLPSTNYVFYVRALCAADDESNWAGPFAFQTAIANNECAGAITVPVNPTEECADVVAGAFTGATASAQATTCSGVNGGDIWFEFTAEESAHGIELSNFAGAAQPVVLALYEGDECGTLTQLYCSANNVINATGLVPGTLYKVRATLNLASPNLNTTFDICVNTPDEPANNNQSECVITTVNFDFESPELSTSQFPTFINHNTVQGWRTTATDQMMEFWPQPNYENVPAYSGTQFIELNANLVSGVYQDYETPQTTVFSYGFAHRGRQGTDTCQLLAGPPGGPYTTVETVTTGNTAWSYNTGTYTVPPGQPITRFIFQSVSSVGGASVGNYLDAITFTANNGILSANPVSLDCVNNVASISAAGVGTWSADPDNPTPTVIADADSNDTTISGFAASGTYLYSWTTQYCTSTLEVTFELGNIDEPVVADITYCQDDTAVPLTAQALPDHTLNWYSDAVGGTPSATAPTPDTGTAGVFTYYVSQVSEIGCESERAVIEVTINETPAAPVANNITYCQNSTAVPLTADALPGNTLNWYTSANGGNPLAQAPTPGTASVGTATYYVSQSSAEDCESDRVALVVTISPSVTPVTGFTYAEACLAGTGALPTPAAGFAAGGTYSADAPVVIDAATGEVDVTATGAGTYTITYTVAPDTDTCNLGGSSQATLVIAPLANAVTDFTYPTPLCSSAGSQLPDTAQGFSGGGTFSAPAGLDINTATGEINVAASTAGSYDVTYTFAEDDVNCIAAGSTTFNVTITDEIVPITAFDFADSYCAGETVAIPTLGGGFTTGGTFTVSGGLNINAATGEVTIADADAGTYTVTYTIAPDAASCNTGGTFTDTFAIGGALNFTLEGDCDGSTYFVNVVPVDGSFDTSDVSYEWTNAQGVSVGTNSETLNVTDYVNSTPGDDSFPLEFMVTVSANGCENSGTITVIDISCTIQRGISPNNDGMNDNFDLTSLNVSKLSIYNRYGKELFTYGNYTDQWYGQTKDGDELPTGTYFYVIERTSGENRTGWIYINREE